MQTEQGTCADWGSVTTEDATQNAALAAIMFLAGGLGKNSPHCIVTLAGSDPAVRPLMLDNQQAQAMLQKQTEELVRAEVSSALAHFLLVLFTFGV